MPQQTQDPDTLLHDLGAQRCIAGVQQSCTIMRNRFCNAHNHHQLTPFCSVLLWVGGEALGLIDGVEGGTCRMIRLMLRRPSYQRL